MMHAIPGLLSADELSEIRRLLAAAPWADGKGTAGYQSALVKANQQVPDDSAVMAPLRAVVTNALARSATFRATVLPLQVFPPLFNRYADGMGFGDHIDNAIRAHVGGVLRTDVSATLFLSDPSSYTGGELVIEDSYGAHQVKLAAGDLIVYPASSVHRVLPVTHGERIACFFWAQSLVRDDGQRSVLHDLDIALGALRRRGLSGEAEMISLTGIYHNLLRRWAGT